MVELLAGSSNGHQRTFSFDLSDEEATESPKNTSLAAYFLSGSESNQHRILQYLLFIFPNGEAAHEVGHALSLKLNTVSTDLSHVKDNGFARYDPTDLRKSDSDRDSYAAYAIPEWLYALADQDFRKKLTEWVEAQDKVESAYNIVRKLEEDRNNILKRLHEEAVEKFHDQVDKDYNIRREKHDRKMAQTIPG